MFLLLRENVIGDTKGIIRSRKSKGRQFKYMYISPVLKECQRFRIKTMLENAKGVIRSHTSKDRQYNGQNKKDKQLSTKHYIEN